MPGTIIVSDRMPLVLAIFCFIVGPLAAKPPVIEVRPIGTHPIQKAIDSLDPSQAFTLIRLAPGTYREKIHIPKDRPPFKLLGESADTTRIVWNDSAESKDGRGQPMGTFRSASITIESNDFAAENLCFENDHGPGVQAVALSIGGDRGIFRHCRFLGWQDTLLLRKKRQYFDRCQIAGSVDFIFGDATAFFSRCQIDCRDAGFITAASTAGESNHGFVFSRCRITASGGQPFFLGRPWRPHASVHFLQCELPAELRREGWDNWRDPDNETTARFAEWRSSGPGATPEKRCAWSRQLDDPAGRGLSRPWTILSKWDPDHVLTAERISRLPRQQQTEWHDYLERSQHAMTEARDLLREELRQAGLERPRKPADHGRPPSAERDPEWYESKEADDLAEAVISFQTPSGAWSKSTDYREGPREPGTHWSPHGGGDLPWHYVGTLDNRATTGEIRFLARYYHASRSLKALRAIHRGLDHLHASRFPNGGWPQVWPLEGGYHDHITFNDDAMIHVLELLADVSSGREPFDFVDRNLRQRSHDDLKAGIRCLVDAQIELDGKPAVWCAQHDPLTLAPVGARLQEPASLSSSESVRVVRFLMNHAPDEKKSIESALAWFEASKRTGIRREERDGRRFYDEQAGDAGFWWGRFHDLETNQPIFSGAEDGRIYGTFAELFKHNPTEYAYYTTEARSLLSRDEPAWRRR